MSHEYTEFSRPFWDALREGRLLLQRDRETGLAQFYPRPVGMAGLRGTTWAEASGEGTLIALTRSRVGPVTTGRQDLTYVGIVQLREGPRVFGPVLGDPENLCIGCEMQWVPGEPDSGDRAPFYFLPATTTTRSER